MSPDGISYIATTYPQCRACHQSHVPCLSRHSFIPYTSTDVVRPSVCPSPFNEFSIRCRSKKRSWGRAPFRSILPPVCRWPMIKWRDFSCQLCRVWPMAAPRRHDYGHCDQYGHGFCTSGRVIAACTCNFGHGTYHCVLFAQTSLVLPHRVLRIRIFRILK